MAKMKTEVLYQRGKTKGFGAKARLVAELPRYAPLAARGGGLLSWRDRAPALRALSERLLGFSSRRSLPVFRRDWFRDEEGKVAGRRRRLDGGGGPETVKAARLGETEHDGVLLNPEGAGADVATPDLHPARGVERAGPRPANSSTGQVVLFADTFGRWFDPQTLRAAVRVLAAGGYGVEVAAPNRSKRPLCCGRTYLAAGMVDKAREEARRTMAALLPHVKNGAAIVGLEPSCILTLRDEFPQLLPGEEARLLAERSMLFEEFLAREKAAGRLRLPLRSLPGKAHFHGHCHQKAFGAMPAVEAALRLIPALEVEAIESSCCGMAGAFGYDADTIDVSLAMGELSLLPSVRKAGPDDWIVADGTSCRHQIHDGAQRKAVHVAEVLAAALEPARPV